MKPEDVLHLLAPYLPTDRFRALLRNSDLPEQAHGAALLADISGFTPLTTRLVAEFGAQRASEELKRRINPMFEAVAGQVFNHGGSVIRFTGDGFTAWFDEQAQGEAGAHMPAVLRAVCAGLEMQAVMPYFKGLRLRVCIGSGTADRWVVGLPELGLVDILSGEAVQATVSLIPETQPGQVGVHMDALRVLLEANIDCTSTQSGHALVTALPDGLHNEARRYRWPAWKSQGPVEISVEAVRRFVDTSVRQHVESGLGDFVGELRNAVPLFIQLDMQPDADARVVLNEYVGAVQTALGTSGGRLMSVEVSDKGSVLFAVFGAPISYGDDAERALRVAVSLRDLSIPGVRGARIGVSRGQLFAGTVGGEARHEYSTIGDETNIAARLMTAAQLGQVLASSAVRKEAGPRIVFRDLTPVLVKGRDEPIPVAEPVAIRAGHARAMKGGRFVGRDDEMNQLLRLLKAVRVGHPRVARIEGEAGVGKSRLAAELASRAAELGFRVLNSDCVSTGGHVAYLPWQELLRSLLALSEEMPIESNIRTLSAYLGEHIAGGLPRLPLLGDVLGLPMADTPTTATLTGHIRQQATFALVTEIIMQAARKGPLFILIEDIQWIDEISEALTIDLVQRLGVEPVPLLLVLVHRPPIETDHIYDLLETLTRSHFHTHIVLGELNQNNVTGMIERYLDAAVPPELARFVYDRAQGNPFFVQEMIDTLLETGYIQVSGQRVIIQNPLRGTDLPQTIQGLIQARIDRLGELDKLVLKVASVIGLEFQLRVLEGSIPVSMPHDDLLGRLRVLEQRDFSFRSAAEPDLTYLFKHAITQEVTYQSLLFAQRQQLHHAVAVRLETLLPDGVERLAYHFARSGDHDRARRYLILAGQKAFREYANQAALDYLTQAQALARDAAERFDISGQRVQVMLRLGDTQAVQADLPAMQALAEAANRDDWRAAVHIFWADYFTQTSAWADAIREAQQGVNFAEAANLDMLAWQAYLLLRGAMLSLNQRGLVVRSDLDRKMQALAERLGEQRYVIELILTWFDDLYSEGPEIAIQGAQTALARAEELQDPVLVADCWSVLAELYIREYDLPAALDASRHQLELLRQVGDRRREALTLNRIGWLLINLGQLAESNTQLLDAYRILRQIGERSGEAMCLLNLGMVAEFYHAHDEALAYMERALTAHRLLNAQVDMALTLFHMGNVAIAKGALDEAERHLLEARDILEINHRVRYILQLVEVDAALAEIDLLRGHHATAHERMSAMFTRLQRGQINQLERPGQACWRAIRILQANGQTERATRIRDAFRDAVRPTLEWLQAQGGTWHADYLNNHDFNRAIFG